jgi:hypothetical protein
MAGEFNSPVAKQDPNLSTQELMITFDMLPNINCEKNRYFLWKSNEDGSDYDPMLKMMEQEFLPTIATSLINIDYQVEAQIFHEATFGVDKAVPPVFFPIIVGRNPEGPLDVGTDGMVVTQM